MPIPCGAIVFVRKHGNAAPECATHVGIFLHFGNAFQHQALSQFQKLLHSQKQSSATPLHIAFAVVLGAGSDRIQLRLIPESATHDGDEHPARNRKRVGLHLLELRKNFCGRKIFHWLGAAVVCVYAVLSEFDVLWRA